MDVYEAGSRALAKVAITGGGRCNLTNTFATCGALEHVYPRGHRLMKRLFHTFGPEQTVRWWQEAGVRLVTQPDQCIFPASQDAMQIVNTLLYKMRAKGINLLLNSRVTSISSEGDKYLVSTAPCTQVTPPFGGAGGRPYDAVVVCSGGSPKSSGQDFLTPLGLEMVAPVPSLFTFNINDPIRDLMGTVVERTSVMLAGTKFRAEGPLLITHWGMSGPAILKLSSQAARHLSECGYKARLLVNWMDGANEEVVRQQLSAMIKSRPGQQISNLHPDVITSRHWSFMLERAGIDPTRRAAELGSKQLNRLIQGLTADEYQISGQSRYKDEFVTCGGIALSNINPNTLECKQHPRLYFAGEALDVDAITGGFNLQAAWTMGYVIAEQLTVNS